MPHSNAERDFMLHRIKGIREKILQAGLDAAFISSLENIRYLSGFTSVDAKVLITAEECLLFTDFRYTIQAKEQTQGNYEVIEVPRNGLLNALSAALTRNGCRKTGFEQDAMTVSEFKSMQELPTAFEPFDEMLSALRVIKSDAEICSLQAAQNIADRAFAALLPKLHTGMTEREAAAELGYLCSMYGSEQPAFDTIVGSGPNGAMCHAEPGDRKFENGDMIVFDFGCTVNGYRSDMTRTVAMGEPCEKMRSVYAIVLEAQRKALDALKAGITGRELDAIARDHIAEAGFGDCFGHGLGHGFGLQIHEMPTASAAGNAPFAPGMTITVEPGIYIEGLGGVRIEDCCVVTQDGKINLVSSPKELLILK